MLTIGNYDGIHLGHRTVIEQLHALAREAAAPAAIMTFEPHPKEFFVGEAAPARLTRLREKVAVCATTPIDWLLVVRFDRAFSSLEPEEFIECVLVDRLHVRHVVVGDDFRFGHRAQGDFALLQERGERFGYGVQRTASFRIDGRRVSSGWVREALAADELELAARLLGRPYRIEGCVAEGDRLGHRIGFPTANLPLRRRVAAVSGVYAVRVHGLGSRALPGMANVGKRPTVGGTESRLEVHLFDFDADIYGFHLGVEFVRKLRGEVRFGSVEELRRQLERDEEAARAVLSETA